MRSANERRVGGEEKLEGGGVASERPIQPLSVSASVLGLHRNSLLEAAIPYLVRNKKKTVL